MRTLYIAEDCHQCAKVTDWINEHSREIVIENVDKGGGQPPITTFIYPALFENDGLMAYGEDIIQYLKDVQERAA
jgi:glutaredoxin